MKLPIVTRAGPRAAGLLVALLVAAMASIALSTLGAQQGTPFRDGIDVVQIDVSVLDDKRRPVRGLTAADFTVLEDGKPREIVAFTPVDLPARRPAATPATAAAWTRDVAPDVSTNDVPPEGRLVVIVFDWSIRFMDSTTARRIALETVNNLGPGDQAALVFTSAFATAGAPQNFTSDRSRLIDAINRPFALAVQGDDVVVPARGGFINSNGVLIADPQGYTSGDCRCRVCTLETMTRVADAMRGATGRRKVMIFIGTHFRAYEPGMAAPRGDVVRARPLFPTVGSMGPPLPDALGPGSCSQPLKEARQRMERAASLSNLTIHVVDPVGLETKDSSPLGGGSAQSMMTRQADLHVPADLTGGRTVLNTNAPETMVPAILEESQSYYLVGFSAASAPGDRLRQIEVKVNRPDVQVRSRGGYYGRDEAAARTALASNAPLVRTLDGVLPRADLPLSMVAAPFQTPGKSTGTVAVVVGSAVKVDQSSAAPPLARAGSQQRREQIRVVTAALDPRARVVASREQTVELASDQSGSGGRRYELLSRLELKPGRYEIRVGSDSSAGDRGSVFAFVDVPDFENEPLSLSGIALASAPPVRTAPAGAFADLMTVVPTARRAFGRVDRVTAFVRIHQRRDGTRPVNLVARVLDASDAVRFEEKQTFAADRFASGRGAEYQVDLPIDRLTAGEYALSIAIATGTHEVRRYVRFFVQ